MDLKSYAEKYLDQPWKLDEFCRKADIPKTYFSTIKNGWNGRTIGIKTVFYLIAASDGVLSIYDLRPDLAAGWKAHKSEFDAEQKRRTPKPKIRPEKPLKKEKAA